MFNFFFEILSLNSQTSSVFSFYIYKLIKSNLERFLSIKLEGHIFFNIHRIGFFLSYNNIFNSSNYFIKGPNFFSPKILIFNFFNKYKILNINNIYIYRGYFWYSQYYYNYCCFTHNICNIPQHILKSLNSFLFMKWNSYKINWIRPIENIICTLQHKILLFKFGHIFSNNRTLLTNNINTFSSFFHYHIIFDTAKVYLYQNQRILSTYLRTFNVCYNFDFLFFNKFNIFYPVSNLLEKSNLSILFLKINHFFLSRYLVSCLLYAKNYFLLFNISHINNDLCFLFLSNLFIGLNSLLLKIDFEYNLHNIVLEILFFYKLDLKIKIINKFFLLKKLVFFNKIGTFYHKTTVMKKIF